MQPEEPEHSLIPNASSESPAPASPANSGAPVLPSSPKAPAPTPSDTGASEQPAASEAPTPEEVATTSANPGSTTSTDTPAPSTPLTGNAPAIIEPTAASSAIDNNISSEQSFSTPATSATEGTPQDSTPVVGAQPKKRWLIPTLVALTILIALGGGYIFAFYLPNQPGNVFAHSLKNTADGYDDLVGYEQLQASRQYKGSTTSGTLKLTGQDFSADGNFSLDSSGNNMVGTANLDLAGEKLSANIRSLVANGQTLPDTYVQVNGVKPMLDVLGLNKYDNLDGQWVAIDHTLLQSLSNNAQTGHVSTPTAAQIQDALTKIGTVNRTYLLSTQSNTAVLVNKKYLGKSKQDGREVYGYTVGYNKAHLKAYVAALGQALDGSSLNTWVKQASGKSISSALQPSRIDSLDGNYTFTMYVDAKTKLPHAVRFPDASDMRNYLQFGLNYTGGKSYPFTLRLQTNGIDTPVVFTATATLDTSANKLSIVASLDISGSSPMKIATSFTTVPSNQAVQVAAPSGAVPIAQVLAQLGFSSGATSGSSSMFDTSNLFSL